MNFKQFRGDLREIGSNVGAMLTPAAPITTIGELLDFYEEHHVVFLKNWKGTIRRLRKYVGRFADLRLEALTRRQVIEWYHAIAQTDGPHGATHALQQLHSLYAKADEWELYTGKNPADKVKKFPKHSRTRFVQPHEMPWLLKNLAEELPQVETYFLTILLTGARRDEARLMRWQDLDFERALWHKPTTKTGQPHTIPLPSLLVARLRHQPHVDDLPWVFLSMPNTMNGFRAGPWCGTAVEYHWRRIRKRSGLPDVRIHDLRRTTASWLACGNTNLSTIQQMLGHTTLAVTQIYARLGVEPLRKALDAQAECILRPLPSPPVIPPEPGATREDWPG